ncbi:amidohydrolase family protein [Saccharothrix coeruleofusca]|uniref:Amidohydrolase n=1 Tax=Saccharothrix coeruleofusca TaxID=33919 RepID=A0A918AMA6_9PSEU|nr:amidohydrolase family protein [Saccharothrix coeruleofusca]MBP2338380.1 putative TIM-barrel fold metal-dependent hydrolase [Saccharothrix coeruleofusca]GGP48724.1 amidohydrolase [Saccharothrix coeruleofusca]
MDSLLPCAAGARLVDHHCHGVLAADLDRAGFEERLTEAAEVGPLGTTLFDSSIGLAVLRWCAPVLDLPPHCAPDEYVRRRRSLGAAEVNRAFLVASGIDDFLVDAGIWPDGFADPASWTGRSFDVVRLEALAEDVVVAGARGFPDRVRAALAARDAVAAKSIAAYRVGLDLDPARPSDGEVEAAARRWLGSGSSRCADEVLSRFLVWEAVDRGLPVQFHVGYGDSDVDLHRCDPLLLTPLLRATRSRGVPILLLHNYPFHRHAGYLAQVFPHVFADLGLATHAVGHQASRVLAEALEVVPFGKFLFSTDAFALAELYYLGALLFRRALSDFLVDGLRRGAFTESDAERVCHLVGGGNARRAYRLD